jgi:hypothetical protein
MQVFQLDAGYNLQPATFLLRLEKFTEDEKKSFFVEKSFSSILKTETVTKDLENFFLKFQVKSYETVKC